MASKPHGFWHQANINYGRINIKTLDKYRVSWLTHLITEENQAYNSKLIPSKTKYKYKNF